MIGQTQNAMLQQVEQEVQSKVAPNMASAFQRIVTAGLKLLYSPQTHDFVAKQLNEKATPSEIAGEGTVKIFAVMFKESKGTMPMKAAIPAAQVILCEVLDFMEKAGRAQITDELIADATRVMTQLLLQALGFSKQKLAQYVDAGAKSRQSAAAPAGPAPIIASARQGA